MFHRLRRHRSLWYVPPRLTHPPQRRPCPPTPRCPRLAAQTKRCLQPLPPPQRPSRALLPPRRLHRLL
ncbi:hypothetical protein FIBSPDRAFT_865068, partial [Athelia psychrophila]